MFYWLISSFHHFLASFVSSFVAMRKRLREREKKEKTKKKDLKRANEKRLQPIWRLDEVERCNTNTRLTIVRPTSRSSADPIASLHSPLPFLRNLYPHVRLTSGSVKLWPQRTLPMLRDNCPRQTAYIGWTNAEGPERGPFEREFFDSEQLQSQSYLSLLGVFELQWNSVHTHRFE